MLSAYVDKVTWIVYTKTMLYTAKEVAERLKVSRSWVYTLVLMNRLIPTRKQPLLFTEEEIQRYLNHNQGGTGHEANILES